MKHVKTFLIVMVNVMLAALGYSVYAQDIKQVEYQGWKTVELKNDVIAVLVAPDLGGRVIQLALGDVDLFWVNKSLAGQTAPETGLSPDGGWMNYGGEKIWPAPQGWGGRDDRWPGPPDAVLDGMPYTAKILADGVQLTSLPDMRSGIQFIKTVKVFDGNTRVSIDATMKNIDTRVRRWGVWSVVQLEAANREGDGYNDKLNAYCPLNPDSMYPEGYKVIFGLAQNPQFQADPSSRIMHVDYDYLVGKIGVDNSAGWIAAVDGQAGTVFVQRFVWVPDAAYPDGASVEYWTEGKGTIYAYDQLIDMGRNPAYLMETELLSPFATLEPGKEYTFHYDWYTAQIGGDYPVFNVTDAGASCEPFTAKAVEGKLEIAGRFGVFYKGMAEVSFLDRNGEPIGMTDEEVVVTPHAPLLPSSTKLAGVAVPDAAAAVSLIVKDEAGNVVGELAQASIQR